MRLPASGSRFVVAEIVNSWRDWAGGTCYHAEESERAHLMEDTMRNQISPQIQALVGLADTYRSLISSANHVANPLTRSLLTSIAGAVFSGGLAILTTEIYRADTSSDEA